MAELKNLPDFYPKKKLSKSEKNIVRLLLSAMNKSFLIWKLDRNFGFLRKSGGVQF